MNHDLRISEPIGAQAHARVQPHAITDPDLFAHRAAVRNPTFQPDSRLGTDHRERPDSGAVSDRGVVPDHYVRSDRNALSERDAAPDLRCRRDACTDLRIREEQACQAAERQLWVLHPDQGHLSPFNGHVDGDKRRPRGHSLQEPTVLLCGDEGEIAEAGPRHGGQTFDPATAVSFYGPGYLLGQLGYSKGRHTSSMAPVPAGPAPRIRLTKVTARFSSDGRDTFA
jgi:hypothetical protein